MAKNLPANAKDMGLILSSGRDPWRRKWHPTPVSLPGKSYGQRSLVGYSPWGRKSQTRFSKWMTTASIIVIMCRYC